MNDALELSLALYPDPVLRRVAEPVDAFGPDVVRIVEAMYERMFESRGVGLAAPQVSLRRRIIVLNEQGDRAKRELDLTLVNPRIVARTGPPTVHEEGCLSFPGIFAEIERPECCTVEAQDVEGKQMRREFSGFVSRIIQHEYDHLEGVLLVDRMSPADKLRHRSKLEELVDRYRSSRVGG